ncbi:hypothetical protein E4U39_003814 [Claviceps sp. Clav50 group G5]|nr:hypothetical protein E4U39_003814 [Claviceps sp. Clav50 group G5]
MTVALHLKHFRNAFPPSRACISRVTSPQRSSQRLIHAKGGKSGEEGQFKAVTASQSVHEPSQEMMSKPPEKAAKQERKPNKEPNPDLIGEKEGGNKSS